MMIQTQPVYNTIGKTYDITRKAEPFIVDRIVHYLKPQHYKKYLDIGCGSGNYTGALSARGLDIAGIDISPEMLKKARQKFPEISWYEGDARALPFQDACYSGATCVLATHHIQDIHTAFKQAYRVLNQGQLVIFTATPEQCRQYWLMHYFPQLIEQSARLMSSYSALEQALLSAGFKQVKFEPYFVTPTLQDWFLHAGKYRPEIYLDPVVRAGISSFQLAHHAEEVEQGLKLLSADIKSGKIKEIIADYESKVGDYLFVVAQK